VLAFDDVSPLLRLFVVDRRSITSSHNPHVYAFTATHAMAPQVTLSWTDPPMRTTQLSLSTLVNDLHLELRSPSGRVVTGNFAQYVVNGRAYAVYDSDNNNERVVVHNDTAEAGVWTVVVRVNVNQMLKPPQLYALVFSAAVPFSRSEQPLTLSCPNSCSGNGNCVTGGCMCYDDWAGIACDMPILTAPLGHVTTSTLTLNPQSWVFVRVPVALGSVVTVQQTSAIKVSGDADMYMVARLRGEALRLPSFAATINQTSPPDDNCDSCCDAASGRMQPCPPSHCTHSISFTVTDASVSEYVHGVNAFLHCVFVTI
jgi:hypothetical protein